MLFAVLKTVRYVHPDSPGGDVEVVESGEISVFVGRDFVITVRRGEPGGLRGLRRALDLDPERLALGPSAVLHAIMDRVVDDYLAVVESMQLDIDAVETAVFGGPARSRRDAERIYVLEREVLELRRAVTPLAGPLRTLSEGPVRLVAPEIREYFRDVEDTCPGSPSRSAASTSCSPRSSRPTWPRSRWSRTRTWADLGGGGDPGDPDRGGRHLRHELLAHARAGVLEWKYGYPLTLVVIAGPRSPGASPAAPAPSTPERGEGRPGWGGGPSVAGRLLQLPLRPRRNAARAGRPGEAAGPRPGKRVLSWPRR
jgi:hypothetical protein